MFYKVVGCFVSANILKNAFALIRHLLITSNSSRIIFFIKKYNNQMQSQNSADYWFVNIAKGQFLDQYRSWYRDAG